MKRRLGPALLYIITAIFLLPILIALVNSFNANNSFSFENYLQIIKFEKQYREGFVNSIIVSTIAAIAATFISFYFSFLWNQKKKIRIYIVTLILLIALVPGDLQALGIKYAAIHIFKIISSPYYNLVFALALYSIPYCFIIMITGFSFIKISYIYAAHDLHSSTFYLLVKVIIPLLTPAIISSLLLSFLISMNEFTRTYYLKGGYRFLSEIIFGEFSSGKDNSVFAIGVINILLAIGVLSLLLFFYRLKLAENTKKK